MNRNRRDSTTRIGLDVERDRNRELLAGLFSEENVVEFSGPVPDGTDLCIVDETTVERSPDRFGRWHADQSPVFAPVVLLSETEVSNPWEELAATVRTYVDAVFRIPMPRAELSSRVENLLRMRTFSRELNEEKQLTEMVFESSPMAKLVIATDGTIVRANDRAGELFEVEPADLVGRAYHDGDWTAVREDGTEIPTEELPFERVLATGTPVYDHEHVVERPGHEDMWVSVNMAPIRDETGGLEYVVAVIEDITVEHTQAKKLEQQVDLFRKAQTIADVGAWEYDVRTGEFYWTDQVYEMFDVSTDRTPTTDLVVETYHPADRDRIRTAFTRAIEDGAAYDFEGRIQTSGGDGDGDDGVRWVRVRGEPQFAESEVVRVRGTVQDITDRKERAAELERMSNAVERAPIGITLSDPSREDNPLVSVNRGFEDLTGYTREEAVGRNCRFLQGPGTNPETVDEIRRAVDAERPVSVTIRNYRADGTPFWNALDIAPVRDDDGTVVNYIGFQQDVTGRVERQRQLKILDRYLRHNVRNKMNLVNGLADLIREEGSPSVAEYAESIAETGATLLGNMEKERAVTQLLREDSEPTTVELTDLVETIAAEFSEAYPEAEITVHGPESARVVAIPELPTAFRELVANAIEHHDGASPTVDVEVDRAGDTVGVTVADDGPGMPEMEVDVLVDADSETTVNHGQGLGLWLVYLIVKRSGGHLSFADREAGGSVVTVELPVPDGETN